MTANTLYRASPLEAFIDDVAARSGYQHALGDYEGARLQSQHAPVIWRHPIDRYILEFSSPTDHRSEIDPFAQADETLEMVVAAPDYVRALHMLLEIYRKAFDPPAIERAGVMYLNAVGYGKVRRPRTNEVFPKGVPTLSFVLIDLVTITWLAPRQAASLVQGESVSVDGKMYEGVALKGTIEAPIP